MAKYTLIKQGDNKKLKAAPAHDHSKVLTADGQINISQSKVKTYRECRRRYHNKFVLGLQKKKIKRPFMFGTIIHKIAEARFEREDWTEVLDKIELDNKKLFKREVEMYGNIVDDIRDIMTDYFDYWENHPTDAVKPIKHGGRRSEHEFRIEIASGVWFTGKIDAVVRARAMRWVMEHKSFARMPGEDDRWRSVQAAVYFRALEMMGFEMIDGVLWDYVSSKACNVPGQLTATGKVSQARIDSLPTRIERWIKEEGYKRKDYLKLIQDAEANRPNRFIRIYSPIKRVLLILSGQISWILLRRSKTSTGRRRIRISVDTVHGVIISLCVKQKPPGRMSSGSLIGSIKQEDLSHKADESERAED